jgi:large subunit ribosomal protein L17
MRHRRKNRHFGRKTTALKALWRGLIISIVEHGRITTTVDKAKELRRHVEPMITLGKKNDLASRRLLLSRVPNKETVNSIMTDLSPRFKDRNGGYTRIIKIGRRPGDTVEMAFIEFVDYDWEKAGKGKKVEAGSSEKGAAKEGAAAAAKTKAKPEKTKAGAVVAKKKVAAKKMQKKARAAARA